MNSISGHEVTSQEVLLQLARRDLNGYDARDPQRECSATYCRRAVDPSSSFKMCLRCRTNRRENRRKQHDTVKGLNGKKKVEKLEGKAKVCIDIHIFLRLPLLRILTSSYAQNETVDKNHKQAVSVPQTSPKTAEAVQTLPMAQKLDSFIAERQTSFNPSSACSFYLPQRLSTVTLRLHEKIGSRSLPTSTSMIFDDLEKERRKRAKLRHFDDHGFFIPVNVVSASPLERQINATSAYVPAYSQGLQESLARNPSQPVQPVLNTIVLDPEENRLHTGELTREKVLASDIRSATKIQEQENAIKDNRIQLIKILPRSTPIQDQNDSDPTPSSSGIDQVSSLDNRGFSVDTTDFAGWDSELSDLSSGGESAKPIEEEQRSQLKIRIFSQHWRTAAELTRCCSRCHVQLSPEHSKKQCSDCLRLFRDYRNLRKAGIKVPQGFLNVIPKVGTRENGATSMVLPKIKLPPLRHTAPSYQSLTLMMSALRHRLDEFIYAHAEYLISRERDSKTNDKLAAVRFTFRGECSTVLRREGSVSHWNKNASRVRERLQVLLGTNITVQRQSCTLENGMVQHFVGVLDVPIPLVTRPSDAPASMGSNGSERSHIQSDDEDMPVLKVPSDNDDDDDVCDSTARANIADVDGKGALQDNLMDNNGDPTELAKMFKSLGEDIMVVKKNMRVTVKIVVRPDRSHRLLPGQCTFISFQLEG